MRKMDNTDTHKTSEPLVLKKNEYKCVELRNAEDGTRYIAKSYSGHPVEHLKSNTLYIYAALEFFNEQFSSILQTPEPYRYDLDFFEVNMEYLPDLPKAKLLSLQSISKASPFFHKCYSITENHGFLRTIHGSVVITPKVEVLLEQDIPMALGLKGDLKENLCEGDTSLILADIDSICLEPLGLSELVLYAELYAALNFIPTVISVVRGIPTPVAFEYVGRKSATALIEAAIEIMSLQMKHLPPAVQKAKIAISRKLLNISASSINSV